MLRGIRWGYRIFLELYIYIYFWIRPLAFPLAELSLQRLWRPRGSIARPGIILNGMIIICGQWTSCNPCDKMWNASKVCHIFSCKKIKSSLFASTEIDKVVKGQGWPSRCVLLCSSLLPDFFSHAWGSMQSLVLHCLFSQTISFVL